jgi:hypothetical protein
VFLGLPSIFSHLGSAGVSSASCSPSLRNGFVSFRGISIRCRINAAFHEDSERSIYAAAA